MKRMYLKAEALQNPSSHCCCTGHRNVSQPFNNQVTKLLLVSETMFGCEDKRQTEKNGPWSTEKDKHIQRAIAMKCHGDDDDGDDDDGDSSSHLLIVTMCWTLQALNRQAFL